MATWDGPWFGVGCTYSLGWTLRERTVVPIAVLSRFFSFPLAVKIRR
ncbi:hypothetical protein M2105_001230, partial [Paenibacillus sp. PastF-1]|nr:hypothetical protein [Paenibacillus sp. PastF-2]MDF9846813.1 hypothetical protein [Paenibacillus sp. PastM-2]MDF9853385.1 hypothetical protein [Paenibacillus sp. PastF-1]MDH6479128.1 hypothetical protein [Paenibacillus sp. PastH-2]